MGIQSPFSGGLNVLTYILYVSELADHCGQDDIRDILKTSRENNSKNSVTGMLISKDKYFLQYIEGPEAQIVELFDKIKNDERHRAIKVVNQGSIFDRVFFNWEMGFADEKIKQPLHWKWQLDQISMLTLAEDADDCLTFVKAFLSAPNLAVNSPSL
jgi:hypothetical protein